MIKKAIISSILLSTLLTTSTFAVTGRVTGNTVRIRERADSKAPEVSVATKNETVDIIGEEGNWYKVNFEDVTGYISKDYVSSSENSNQEKISNTTQKPENQNTVSNKIETPTNSNESNTIGNSVETPKNEVSNETTNSIDDSNNEISNSVDNTNSMENPKNEISVENSNTVDNSNENNQNEISDVSFDIPNYEKNQTVKFEQNAELKYLPNFTSRVSHKASNGEEYTVVSVLNNWVKVQNDNKSGWVLKTNITKQESTSENTISSNENQISEETNNVSNNESTSSKKIKKGTVNVDSAVIRDEPNGSALTSIKKGKEVTILGEKDDWYNISVEEFDSCYIAKRLITEK